MNAIEKLAIQKLKEYLYSAQDRCNEKNADRMQHERIFVLRDIKDALKVVDALEENGK